MRSLDRVALRTGVACAATAAVTLLGPSTPWGASAGQPVSSRAPAVAEALPPLASGGVPFGASKVPSDLYGKPFTETKIEVEPDSILGALTEARRASMRVFIVCVGGAQRRYQNPDGTFNLAVWKARLDKFRGIDLSSFITDGTILGHQLVSESKARSQFGGKVIANEVLDEMARYSKELWPTMPTMLRTDPTDLEEHAAGYKTPSPGWRWRYLDTASARYLFRKDSVAKFATEQQASADRQKLALVVGLNVFSGGDGSSAIASPSPGKWAMSPDELRRYGSTLLSQTQPCAFEMWRFETPKSAFENFIYFRRPEIAAAMADLAALAARTPARSCRAPERSDQPVSSPP